MVKYDLRFLAGFVPLVIAGAWLAVVRVNWRAHADLPITFVEGAAATLLILICAVIWLFIQTRRREERRRRKPPLDLSRP